MKCFGCGVEKDLYELEIYPYPEDKTLCDDPIPPLMVLECQRRPENEWKACVVCFECFRKLDPDLWISENCWNSINPIIKFDDLPLANEDEPFKLENYYLEF
jgi:hypothetical protein